MIRLKERKILATDLIALLNLSYFKLSLDLLSTHFLGTSSGSVNLNSPLVPFLMMIAELAGVIPEKSVKFGYAKNPRRPVCVMLTSM